MACRPDRFCWSFWSPRSTRCPRGLLARTSACKLPRQCGPGPQRASPVGRGSRATPAIDRGHPTHVSGLHQAGHVHEGAKSGRRVLGEVDPPRYWADWRRRRPSSTGAHRLRSGRTRVAEAGERQTISRGVRQPGRCRPGGVASVRPPSRGRERRLNLGWTVVRAIAGRVKSRGMTEEPRAVGAARRHPLTTVVSLDSMYLYFDSDSRPTSATPGAPPPRATRAGATRASPCTSGWPTRPASPRGGGDFVATRSNQWDHRTARFSQP
jgi:hypothetical protein